jgi:hypothetical protein
VKEKTMSDVNQPLRDGDATAATGPDAAQREWESTESPVDPSDPTTAGGDRGAWDEDIPREDLPTEAIQPDNQGDDPVTAALGDERQGALAPEDE